MSVDIGHQVTSTTAIYDGYRIKQGCLRVPNGGHVITKLLGKFTRECNRSIAFERVSHETFRDIKERHVRVASISEQYKSYTDKVEYLLPDGSRIEIGNEKYACTEVLFNPEVIGQPWMGIQKVSVICLSGSNSDS